jgi:hypothetical protein
MIFPHGQDSLLLDVEADSDDRCFSNGALCDGTLTQ